ncbi:Cytochrome C biogenesis protein transmembrane region [Beijerinckiaceae bacterium RH AL1]|nr:sulfite exporter TauE/SafE family protein [Beijerinckiaceae bacterium]VVB49610.1 Cytochrome C biogenesis protein transmembrane region [Beijerinckiaceae bacterium RH CH11]VVB49688.1 Cytochrome C biogenesis protein transmembrane region [Beijerinckiaceae bacterium RH AL8]VVC56990.1 Cytochrome C biogenesis protein transmembrane region [Beijerinckiaceae bacterium RH AL1]
MHLPSVLFAFVAGILSILGPCVLPLVPIVLATAVSEHKLGPVALAAGVAVSFAAIGIFVATIGFAAGIGSDVFQKAAAILLILIGIVLLLPALQMRFATAAGPVGAFAQERLGGFSSAGLLGQFGVGLLLGAVWSPCTGPTLGAAAALADQSKHLGLVALVMLAYGIGAALPLALLGFLSRETILRLKGGMLSAGKALKVVMGLFLIGLGGLMLSGYDKTVETQLVAASPSWLTDLTTRF